jgi:hypothetical protein
MDTTDTEYLLPGWLIPDYGQELQAVASVRVDARQEVGRGAAPHR